MNPFSMLGPQMDVEALIIEKLHEKTVSDSLSIQEGLLIMICKLIEMTRLLTKYVRSGSLTQMEKCSRLGKEVHAMEQILTKQILQSDIKEIRLKGIIRFPYRLERTGDMLESILRCCRTKALESILFNSKAHSELDKLFATLIDMMNTLRDAFKIPDIDLLNAVLAQGTHLDEMIESYKQAHWKRLEEGSCVVQASSIYRDILDSAEQVNEYLVKMAHTLLELSQTSFEEPQAVSVSLLQ